MTYSRDLSTNFNYTFISEIEAYLNTMQINDARISNIENMTFNKPVPKYLEEVIGVVVGDKRVEFLDLLFGETAGKHVHHGWFLLDDVRRVEVVMQPDGLLPVVCVVQSAGGKEVRFAGGEEVMFLGG